VPELHRLPHFRRADELERIAPQVAGRQAFAAPRRSPNLVSAPSTPVPPTPLQSNAAWRTTLRTVLIVVAVGIALYLIYLLRKPLTWIFIAGFLAIALAGPVQFLQRRLPRGLAIAIVYVALIVSPVLVMGILVPPIVTQANNLADDLPQYARDLSAFVTGNDTLNRLQEDYDLTAKVEEEAAKLPGRIGDAAGVLSDIGLGIVNSVFTAVTIAILSVFLMGAGPRWLETWARRYPPEQAEWWRTLFRRIGNAVGNYVAGALLQATVAGVLSYVVLLVLGIPFALPLAVVIFLLDLVPLVGATLGAVLVGLVTVFNDFPVDTIVWTIWAVIYQQVENNVIQPRIQAKAVQLEPLIVLISVLFGSTLFGVLGALLAIPVAAAIQITIREYRSFRNPSAVGAVSAPTAGGDAGPSASPS
jgi:predicted PurR-regulated permease PerM